MEREEVFQKELWFIHNQKIREFTVKALNKLPEYFFSIPASSTGKYHPSYALGDGGLVRHTKAAVRIAVELFTINSFTDEEKDIVVSALILHDGFKSGMAKSMYTVHEHPELIAKFIKEDVELNQVLDGNIINAISDAVHSHMGQWNTNSRSMVVLPTPTTKIQRFVHMCDYLASRKCLEFNFDV
jgi:23S rRNA maturation-related 3'-5' exoribonuclease YhaM